MCTYGFVCSGAGVLAVCKGGLWTWDEEIACATQALELSGRK